jgi:hypothetical protein
VNEGIKGFKHLRNAKLNKEKVGEWLQESGKFLLEEKPTENQQPQKRIKIQGNLFGEVGEVLKFNRASGQRRNCFSSQKNS